MMLSIIRWGGEPPPQSYHLLHPSTLNWSHFSKYTKWFQTLQRFTHAIPSAYSYLLQTYLPTAQQPSNHPPACPPFPASAKTSLTSPQKLSTHLSCHWLLIPIPPSPSRVLAPWGQGWDLFISCFQNTRHSAWQRAGAQEMFVEWMREV